MSACILAMQSRTLTERVRRIAAAEKIYAESVALDPSVTRHGCASGLRMSCPDLMRLTKLLDQKNIPYGDIIGKRG